MKRNVIYEKQFDDELKVLEPDPDKRDDIIRGIEWVLQRNPRYGRCLLTSDPHVWFVPVIDVLEKEYGIYYTFSDKKVFCLSIREVDGRFADAGEI